HCASVGRRYSQPLGSRPAFSSCSVRARQNSVASAHVMLSTGNFSVFTPATTSLPAPVEEKALGLLFITVRYSPCVTSYFPSQKPRLSFTSTASLPSPILNSPGGHQQNFIARPLPDHSSPALAPSVTGFDFGV